MITYCGKKINIYYREIDSITKCDIIFTYIFLFSSLLSCIIYSYNKYDLINHDLDVCEKHNHKRSCLKSELSLVIVDYIGPLVAFISFLYKLTDYTSCILNCLCCCNPIGKKTSNSHNVSIEMNPI